MLARMLWRWGRSKLTMDRKVSTTTMKIRTEFFRKLKSERVFDPAILFLDICQKFKSVYIRDMCTLILTEHQCATAKLQLCLCTHEHKMGKDSVTNT